MRYGATAGRIVCPSTLVDDGVKTGKLFLLSPMNCVLGFLIILVLAILNVTSANAAFFEIVRENVDYLNNPASDFWFEPKCNVVMTGTFNSQTVADFQEKVKELVASSSAKESTEDSKTGLPVRQGYRALCLFSGGGDLHAALDLIPELSDWIAVVPENAVCTSACAIAFMGAGRDVGPYADLGSGSVNRREARYLHWTGQLSFHAPRLELDETKSFSEKDVIDAYDRSRMTIGRVLYRQSWDFQKGKSAADDGVPNIGNGDAVERMLSATEIDPFLPESLFFAFLVTPNARLTNVDTVEKAMLWGIQIYGLSKEDFRSNVPEFWLWQACSNLAWISCHHPDSLSNGCHLLGVSRQYFEGNSTLPYVLQRRDTSGIERKSFIAAKNASIRVDRISLGSNYQHSGHSYGSLGSHSSYSTDCGISVYKNDEDLSVKGTYQPVDPSWDLGKLDSLGISDEERQYTEKKLIPPSSENFLTLHPWMWVPMNTPLKQVEEKWETLNHLAATEDKWLSGGTYRVLNLCNFTQANLEVAVGAPEQKKVITKGWYRLGSHDCLVPDDFHFGDKFFIFARDSQGGVVKFNSDKNAESLCVPGGAVSDGGRSSNGGGRLGSFRFEKSGAPACDPSDSETSVEPFQILKTDKVLTNVVFGVLPKRAWILVPSPDEYVQAGHSAPRF
jgi:hypothetical protein